jgi:hypothetical protein
MSLPAFVGVTTKDRKENIQSNNRFVFICCCSQDQQRRTGVKSLYKKKVADINHQNL